MLVEYSFGNFKSFKEENSLSMIGVKSFKEHDESHVWEKDKFKILKSSVIYGNNASGKSNLVIGMTLMKNLIFNSFRDALDENSSSNIERFLLNSDNEEIPTLFEVVFFQNDIRYRYGFDIYEGTIINEWLFHKHTVKEVPLFEREGKTIQINKTSFSEGEEFKSKIRDNVLFLSMVAQFDGTVSNEIISWFRNVNVTIGIFDFAYSNYTYKKFMNDPEFEKWLSLIIQELEISNISMEEVDLKNEFQINKNNKIKLDLVAENADGEQVYKKLKGKSITTWHKKYDENNMLLEAVPFNFLKQESEGTKKFINLLGPWYDTIKNGKILIVDELDSRMHTHITRKLVELFNHKKNKKAQLIFTSHDVNLLDKDIFRRDQIWFVEKDQFGASNLYSLADFKALTVRNTSSFIKNYVLGKYGAISHLEIAKDMENLIYG